MGRNIKLSMPQFMSILIITILATSITVLAATGTTDAANAPGLTSSYTLEDIYQRLTNGTTGSQSTFTNPVVAPGTGSMHDLNDIMAAAPALDNTNGATANQVLQGQSFWGLTNGQWGLQTGTIPVRSDVTGTDGQLTFNIPNGYYSGRTATATDSDLVAGNILAGTNIFGVDGQRHGGCVCNGHMVGDTGTRWCDNEDGTITDMQNECLVWLKDAGCLGQEPWGNTNEYVSSLNSGQCGLSDGSNAYNWRLPTLDEMTILTSGTDNVQSSTPQGFTGVQNDYYWTGTINASDSDYAWVFNVGTIATGSTQYTIPYYIWAVKNDY